VINNAGVNTRPGLAMGVSYTRIFVNITKESCEQYVS